MKRGAIVAVSVLVTTFVAIALAMLISKRVRPATLTPAELFLKMSSPPDDSCFKVQLVLDDQPGRVSRAIERLGADEIAIYQAVLEGWNSQSSRALNVANKTIPLNREFIDCECLKVVEVESVVRATHSFHLITHDIPTTRKVRLVDPKSQTATVQSNDPHNSMSQGISPKIAVDRAFATGLFRLSETAFDKDHGKAVVAYSFFCGFLCGGGKTWMFMKVNGEWKRMEHDCGGWIS